ncbi:hypothetical protein VTJ04DRAFT_3453 [Mycothermus thermophilus]|uniref:uncharacterized protein n=1 Tax=Humicola insolens TaxID=85995 RepID=UPI00374329CE
MSQSYREAIAPQSTLFRQGDATGMNEPGIAPFNRLLRLLKTRNLTTDNIQLDSAPAQRLHSTSTSTHHPPSSESTDLSCPPPSSCFRLVTNSSPPSPLLSYLVYAPGSQAPSPTSCNPPFPATGPGMVSPTRNSDTSRRIRPRR